MKTMKIRLAENFRAAFYAPFYVTQALGLYAREGLEVEFVTSAAPGDAVGGLIDGTIDLTWGGPMRVMRAHDTDPNSPLVCFGEVVARDPFHLVGRQDLTDFRLTDLARLRFATVSEVPTPWMCLQHDLRLAGVDPAALPRVTDRTMADNLAALRAGALDVVQLFEPFVAQALHGGFGKSVYAASARGPCVYTSFIATRATVAAKADACMAVVRATAAMQKWLAAEGGAALATAVKTYFPDVAPELLADALHRYHEANLWSVTPEMSRAGFARLADSFLSGGALARIPSYEACVPSSVR
ncbi:MAG TPA: ABC transporter substrate-binding protein [Xanthobacteraceae bacterium]